MTDPTEGVALNLRRFPPDKRELARERAHAHGLTIPDYFVTLLELHSQLIRMSQSGGANATAILSEIGLPPVTH